MTRPARTKSSYRKRRNRKSPEQKLTEKISRMVYDAKRRHASGDSGLMVVAITLLAKHALKDGCKYCSRECTWKLLSLDHVVPLANGGTNDPSNLQLICKPCNRAKGVLSESDYLWLRDTISARSADLWKAVYQKMRSSSFMFFKRK